MRWNAVIVNLGIVRYARIGEVWSLWVLGFPVARAIKDRLHVGFNLKEQNNGNQIENPGNL